MSLTVKITSGDKRCGSGGCQHWLRCRSQLLGLQGLAPSFWQVGWHLLSRPKSSTLVPGIEPLFRGDQNGKGGKRAGPAGLSLFIRKAKAFSECHPSIQLSSGAQSCLTLCDPKDYCMLGFPVYHQLPKLAQTQVHQVGVAIQPSHPPAFNLSQHQGLCQ